MRREKADAVTSYNKVKIHLCEIVLYLLCTLLLQMFIEHYKYFPYQKRRKEKIKEHLERNIPFPKFSFAVYFPLALPQLSEISQAHR